MNINKIAELAGVSRTTISRYLNNGYVSEKNRKKIQKIIDETGYVPSSFAQTLRTKKTNLIGVILPKISSSTISRIVDGISTELKKDGYNVLLGNTDLDIEKEIDYLNIFKNNEVDGIIFLAKTISNRHLEIIENLKIPIVIIGQNIENYSCVYHDDYDAAYFVVDELIKSKCSQIGFIGVGEEDIAVGKERKQGYIDALKNNKINLNNEYIRIGDFSSESGYESCKDLISKNKNIDGIFCVTDNIAIGAMEYLKSQGIKTPEDVSIVSIGDSKVSKVVTPKLSTVHYYYKTSGIEAAKIIINKMKYDNKDIDKIKLGYKYIFIDEITLLADFINTASVLSDIFSMFGMKIVLSGTDSLGFAMANRDELYDRCIMIHTSFISYREYEKLLNIHSIDSYIEYGGTLKMENMTFDDPDIQLNDISFRNDETTRKYIDTSISRNIQHTLKNDHFGEYFNQLKELYNKGELTNAINRIVENINHDFLVKVIEDEFKSHDLGSARNLLLHDVPSSIAYALEEIDKTSVIKRLKSLLDIKEKNETKVKITQECVDKIKKYLLMLDLIVNCPDRYESGKKVDHYIFSQPGMRYSITKALVYSLLQDEYFKSLSESDKEYITNKVLTDVKGRMLEEIVLLEVNKVIHKNKEAFKFKFDAGGEYDMIIYDKSTNTCKLYEIKHSDKIDDRQIRFLVDKDKCELIENKYGTIVGKYVLYRGQNKKIESIDYINVEVFLTNLKCI